MAATLQFVDSIASSPTLRLDINDGTIWLLEAEGTDFSPPALKTASASLITYDGAYRSASAYDNRRLQLRLSLKAASEDDKATKLRALHAELNRETNIIKYQPGTTPLFFRTLRSPEYTLDETETPALSYVDLDVEAEPFAYGLKQTALNAVTLNNNPTAGSNPQYLDISGVLGDVATLAYITIGGVATATAPQVALRAGGAPPAMAIQAETGTLGTDATLPGNDAVMSGAGSNYVRVSFATADAIRITNLTPPGSGTDLRGYYRIFGRFRKSVAGDVITVTVPEYRTTNVVTLPSIAGPFVADLGTISYPFAGGQDPINAGFDAAIGVTARTLSVRAKRVSGTGNLDIDYLLLVPADQAYSVCNCSAASGDSLVLDGPNDAAYLINAGSLSNNGAAPRAGSIPRLTPGVSNRLYFPPYPTGTTSDLITSTWTVTVTYWPRYLVV